MKTAGGVREYSTWIIASIVTILWFYIKEYVEKDIANFMSHSCLKWVSPNFGGDILWGLVVLGIVILASKNVKHKKYYSSLSLSFFCIGLILYGYYRTHYLYAGSFTSMYISDKFKYFDALLLFFRLNLASNFSLLLEDIVYNKEWKNSYIYTLILPLVITITTSAMFDWWQLHVLLIPFIVFFCKKRMKSYQLNNV